MADVVVGEHYLPAHTLIVPQISCALHDPNVFPNPTQFRPERFLDEKTGLLKRVDEFIPFSLGKRQCVGEFLSYILFPWCYLKRIQASPWRRWSCFSSRRTSSKRLRYNRGVTVHVWQGLNSPRIPDTRIR